MRTESRLDEPGIVESGLVESGVPVTNCGCNSNRIHVESEDAHGASMMSEDRVVSGIADCPKDTSVHSVTNNANPTRM